MDRVAAFVVGGEAQRAERNLRSSEEAERVGASDGVGQPRALGGDGGLAAHLPDERNASLHEVLQQRHGVGDARPVPQQRAELNQRRQRAVLVVGGDSAQRQGGGDRGGDLDANDPRAVDGAHRESLNAIGPVGVAPVAEGDRSDRRGAIGCRPLQQGDGFDAAVRGGRGRACTRDAPHHTQEVVVVRGRLAAVRCCGRNDRWSCAVVGGELTVVHVGARRLPEAIFDALRGDAEEFEEPQDARGLPRGRPVRGGHAARGDVCRRELRLLRQDTLRGGVIIPVARVGQGAHARGVSVDNGGVCGDTPQGFAAVRGRRVGGEHVCVGARDVRHRDEERFGTFLHRLLLRLPFLLVCGRGSGVRGQRRNGACDGAICCTLNAGDGGGLREWWCR
mmetsp:Transcript_47691/g.147131  ORF Transcript_47691/g.147131 Transcript_47691/m.147131 type:complete len:392 (-) Transcript_47691:1503-2678(-)